MDNVYLIGAEDVARAGSAIRGAAHEIQNAAGIIDQASRALIMALEVNRYLVTR